MDEERKEGEVVGEGEEQFLPQLLTFGFFVSVKSSVKTVMRGWRRLFPLLHS